MQWGKEQLLLQYLVKTAKLAEHHKETLRQFFKVLRSPAKSPGFMSYFDAHPAIGGPPRVPYSIMDVGIYMQALRDARKYLKEQPLTHKSYEALSENRKKYLAAVKDLRELLKFMH